MSSNHVVSVPLADTTEEYGLIEYFLQLSCRTASVKVRNAWSLSIPHVKNNFEQRTRGQLVLPCFVPISQLDHLNPVQEVCQRGFKFDTRGFLIQVGNFGLPGVFQDVDENGDDICPDVGDHGGSNINNIFGSSKSKARFLAGGRRLYEVFFCHAGVGKSHLTTPDDSNLENMNTERILRDCPYDFDSVYLHRKKKKLFQDIHGGISPQHTFQHDYLLKDASQLMPVYLVHFELDTDLKDPLLMAVCDSCTSRPAVVWCEADSAKLCEDCDVELHSLNHIVARHQRVPVYEMPRYLGECDLHKDEVYQYCSTCNEFLCNNCLTAGSHSTPEVLRTHSLMSLQEAYRSVIRSNVASDARFITRQEHIKASLSNLEEFVAQLNRSGKAAEDRLYSLVQETLEKCQNVTEHYVVGLLCDEVAIKRQIQLFEWMDAFMRKQMLELSPPDFLATWAKHCNLRMRLSELFDVCENSTMGEDSDSLNYELTLGGGVKVATVAPP